MKFIHNERRFSRHDDRSVIHLQFTIYNLCLAVCFLAVSSCHNPNVKSNQQVRTGDSATKRPVDTIPERINFYSGKLAANPNDANAYWNRGKLELLRKDLAPSLSDLTKAVQLDSTNSNYFSSLADIYFTVGKTHEAKDAFEVSLRLNPKNTEAILQFAELYSDVKLYQDALDMVDRAIKINPYIAREYFQKGLIFWETHDTTKAISSLRTAIEQDPELFLADIQLGIIFASTCNPIALNYFDDAKRLQAQNPEPYYDKGQFYQNCGDYDDAIKAFNEIFQVDSIYQKPDTMRKHACYNIGYIYSENKNDYSNSLKYFDMAIKSDTGYSVAYFGRAYCYEKLNKIDPAIADYAHAYAINHNFIEAAIAYKRLKSEYPK